MVLTKKIESMGDISYMPFDNYPAPRGMARVDTDGDVIGYHRLLASIDMRSIAWSA